MSKDRSSAGPTTTVDAGAQRQGGGTASNLCDRLQHEPVLIVQPLAGQAMLVRRRPGRVEALDKFRRNLSVALANSKARLESAILAVLSTQELVTDLDPEDGEGYASLFASLAAALEDLRCGRTPPKWLQLRRYDRPASNAEQWIVRAHAVAIYVRAREFRVSRGDALRSIEAELRRHSFPITSANALVEWRRRFRDRSVPIQGAQQIYDEHMRGFQQQPRAGEQPATALRILHELLLPELARRLSERGYAARGE